MTPFKSSLLAGLFTLATSFSAAAANLDDPAVVEAFVDGLVKPLMKNNNSPAGTVAIVKEGQLIFAKGYGYQDIENQVPVDPYRTLFRPGSVSKLFTWVSVMQQVEQGKLDLDADVNDYLTAFKIKDTFERPVTMRDIMTHSPGFEDGGMGYLIIDDPANALPMAEALEMYQPARVNPPGAQTSYTNYGTALAGHIVAVLSGLSFQEYVQQNIFDPLGMQNSSFFEPLPDRLLENMAVSYNIETGKYVEKPFEIILNFAPAGSQSATSTDMVKFALAILNGGELNGTRILKADTVEEMLTRNFTHDDRMMGLALGFYETEKNGIRLLGHGGDTAWFHSELVIDREHDLAFFVSFAAPGGGAARSSFKPAFYDEFFPKHEAPPVPPEGFSERAAKYAGSYGFWRANYSTVEKAFGLGGGIQVAPTEDNTLMVSMGDKAKQYVEIENNLFRQLDNGVSIAPGLSPRLMAFQENEAGEITGFYLDGLPFMSTRKMPAHETMGLLGPLLGLSFFVFLGVILRRFFQRAAIKTMATSDRSALSAAFYASVANWLVVIIGAIVITMVADRLSIEVPMAFKLWLIVPIIATLAGIYLLYQTVLVWTGGRLGGLWARLRYTLVALCALFMCWFYYFWNILGFQLPG